MLHQEGTHLSAIGLAFAHAHEKGFEIGAAGMRTRPTFAAGGILVVQGAPIEQGKEGTIVLHHGVGFTQASQGVLVKGMRIWYHRVSSLSERNRRDDVITLLRSFPFVKPCRFLCFCRFCWY